MNILIASKICPDAISELRKAHCVSCAWSAGQEQLVELAKNCEAIVFRSGVQITAALMAEAPNLRLLIRAGSGLDNLDLDYVNSRGFMLQRIPEPGARAVTELTFGFMLLLARQIMVVDHALRKGRWLKNEIKGYLLKDKTLGIIGSGNIGTMVGQMGVAWGLRVIACVAHPSAERASQLGALGINLTSFDEVLQKADFISLHVPLGQATENLIGESELKRMKRGAYLINLARGGVVDEMALFRALNDEKGLAGAALDVHAQEGEGQFSALAELSNVVLTPHIGATTIDTQREIGRRVVMLIEDVAKKSPQWKLEISGRCDDGQQIKTA